MGTLRIRLWSSIRLLLSTGHSRPAKAEYHDPID